MIVRKLITICSFFSLTILSFNDLGSTPLKVLGTHIDVHLGKAFQQGFQKELRRSWGIDLEVIDGDLVRVSFRSELPANHLREIGICPLGKRRSLVSMMADGSRSYRFKLSLLPDGAYQVKLLFWPGFHLVETVEKVNPDR